jgi:hypothetical protein
MNPTKQHRRCVNSCRDLNQVASEYELYHVMSLIPFYRTEHNKYQRQYHSRNNEVVEARKL